MSKVYVKDASISEIRQKMLTGISINFLGIKEKPNNSGFFNKDFQNLMESYGWQKGWPWCMSFVKTIYLHTEMMFGNPKRVEKLYQLLSASVHNTWKAVKSSSEFQTSKKPLKPGCIVFWDTGHGHGHAGIYLGYKDKEHIYEVEGNTNGYGSRDGEYVAIKSRTLRPKRWKLLGFAQLKEK